VPKRELLLLLLLQERISGVLGSSLARGITAGTFHSICSRILR